MSLVAPVIPIVQTLLKEYWSLGLFEKFDLRSFVELLLTHFNAEDMQEWVEDHEDDGDLSRVRRYVLCRLQGIVQNVGFAASDVLGQARRCLAREGLDLSWEPEKSHQPTRDIKLRLGPHELRWHYSVVSGLVQGVNTLLATAGKPSRFVGLATDGDYYAYVFANATVQSKLLTSALLQVYEEPDPYAGPVI
jgi:hypothetical protein